MLSSAAVLPENELHTRPGLPGLQRIAHFTDTYLPRRDGVIASVQTLQRGLSALGTDSLTVVPQHPSLPTDSALMPIASMPVGVASLRLAMWPLQRHVDRVAAWRPDVIHVHTPGPVGLLGVLAAARLGVPVVHTYHTDLHAYAEAYRVPTKVLALGLDLYRRRLSGGAPVMKPSSRGAVLDELNRLLFAQADAVVLPTPAVLGRATLPVAPQRIFLVPAAVAGVGSTPALAARFRASYGLLATDKVVLFVGRVNREKGIELLLEAFAAKCLQVPSAKLVLIGAIYERRWLTKLIAQHGLRDRVVLTGQLGPHDVAAGYANADVFAFPSLTDTQGLVLQEAALAGVPSVLADPMLHSTGVLGSAAVLAGPEPSAYGEALRWLLADPAAAHRIGSQARQRALAYTPATYAEAVRDVYAFAANSDSRRA